MQQVSALIDHHKATFDWRDRLRAASIHLALSALVAALAAVLVFALWYPFPYRDLSGGRELFLLLVSVDVVLGPLITFAIFDRAKSRTGLRRDLAVVVVLQVIALLYGLWTVQLARPVHMVFEIERFRVVHRSDIPSDLEGSAPAGIEVAPWTGPTLLAVRPFRSEQEKFEATQAALQGIALSARPDLWQSYADARPRVLQAAHPLSQLKSRFAAHAGEIDAAVRKAQRSEADVAWLPVVGRKAQAWTVLLDKRTAQVLDYLPLDSF
jgi:hypothetical protein